MRNRLVHAYLDIDLDIVWNTIQTELAAIHALASRELDRLRDEQGDSP